MINFLRKITPKFVFKIYHFTLAVLASFIYGNPSNKMIVIGVTGTNGKSTTVNLIAKLLESQNAKTGFASTSNFKIDDKEWLNSTKMTMLGRFKLQKMLSQMTKVGCKYAIIETSSQGIEQFRHYGINYDYAVFTNLTPEHIEAHGGFENYKSAKGKLFARLSKLKNKIIEGKIIEKKIFVNLDDSNVQYFLQFSADKKVGYTLNNKVTAMVQSIYNVSNIKLDNTGINFNFEGLNINSSLLGEFNVYNLACALSVCFEELVSFDVIEKNLKKINGVPGRMELINERQDFTVLIDYAPEPDSLKNLYKTLNYFTYNNLIHVLGSCGGGRDVARRPILGSMAGKKANIVIVTNEDPYDDDPMEIINAVAKGSQEVGKIVGKDLLIIEDRKDAIIKAINLAQKGDLVLITGKGCEVGIMVKNRKIVPHDDRAVARQAIINKIKK